MRSKRGPISLVNRPDGADAGVEPLVETPAGGFSFLNAVLAAPALIVLTPTVVRGTLLGALDSPSPWLDPVPAVAPPTSVPG